MRKNILLIGYNFYPELTGIGKYSGEMMQWLAQKGYHCHVVTAYPYYPFWQVQEPYTQHKHRYFREERTFESGGKLTVYRCPMYIPDNPTGLKRMVVDFSFLISAFLKVVHLCLTQEIAVAIAIAPSFLFGTLGALCKTMRKATFMYHIQDLQIEAARDLKMIKSAFVINALLKIEKYIFNKADIISSISSGMIAKIEKKANKSAILFPNWTDINSFYPVPDKAAVKMAFGYSSTDKIILYSGAIGEKQGLDAILLAANEYRNESSLKFIICGSGPFKHNLQRLAEDFSLPNIDFFPLQPLEKFNQFLNIADVHLIIQKSHASDLVMPSKLTTILAVGGLALITADENSSLYSLVNEYDMGILIKPENQQALNDGIRRAIFADNSIQTRNARAYAEAHLSIDGVMENLIKNINL